MVEIKKAVAKKQNLRMALSGPPGSGKTMTALKIAKHLGNSVLVIDTERESAEIYAGLNEDIPEFDTAKFTSFDCSEAARFIRSVSGKYDTLIIDSGSHFWEGPDGILDTVSKKGNTQQAWGAVKVDEQAFLSAILDYSGHVIVTYRTANDYAEIEDARGKKKRQKIGFKAKTREGMEYEFTVTAYLDDENVMTIEKTRFAELNGKSFRAPGKEVALLLKAACARGVGGAEDLIKEIRSALALVQDKPGLAKWLTDYTQPIKTIGIDQANAIRAEYKAIAEKVNATNTGRDGKEGSSQSAQPEQAPRGAA